MLISLWKLVHLYSIYFLFFLWILYTFNLTFTMPFLWLLLQHQARQTPSSCCPISFEKAPSWPLWLSSYWCARMRLCVLSASLLSFFCHWFHFCFHFFYFMVGTWCNANVKWWKQCKCQIQDKQSWQRTVTPLWWGLKPLLMIELDIISFDEMAQ